MQKPTVGRVVWVFPPKDEPGIQFKEGQPLRADVINVIDDETISVKGTDIHGNDFVQLRVTLTNPSDKGNTGQWRAEWMPYQQQQHQANAANNDAKVPSQFGTQYPDTGKTATTAARVEHGGITTAPKEGPAAMPAAMNKQSPAPDKK